MAEKGLHIQRELMCALRKTYICLLIFLYFIQLAGVIESILPQTVHVLFLKSSVQVVHMLRCMHVSSEARNIVNAMANHTLPLYHVTSVIM